MKVITLSSSPSSHLDPYDEFGRVLLPPASLIVECSIHCSCPLSCPLRVVQRAGPSGVVKVAVCIILIIVIIIVRYSARITRVGVSNHYSTYHVVHIFANTSVS